ncbi:MAG: Thymidylate synthase ThyX [bacterium ADurb.Bin243]|nr:MAG: Thymidylate synthase ThyX [bacterium ADurb.Bin243]
MSTTVEQKAEIPAAATPTRRATVDALEARLGLPIPVLDHGFIRVVDYMGDDAAIVQAARVSYGAGTKTARDDAGLIRYLMRHWHSTPFEMCELKLHVKLPVFVARQWIRHRTARLNEISGRYSVMKDEFYHDFGVYKVRFIGIYNLPNIRIKINRLRFLIIFFSNFFCFRIY